MPRSGKVENRQNSKRARVEESPAPASAAPPHAQAAALVDALPDALLGDVFKALGLQASWPLRRVCRRWRRAIEETEWADVDLRISGGKAADWSSDTARSRLVKRRKAEPGTEGGGEQSYSQLMQLFESRRVRLGSASVSLQGELPVPALSNQEPVDDHTAFVSLRRSHRLVANAACGLLAAIACRNSGPAQLREVTVELLRFDDSEMDFLSAYLLGVLRALRPPEGAASALESLSVSFSFSRDFDRFLSRDIGNRTWLPWPRAPELQAALAPFGALRSLAFHFSGLDEGISPHVAAAIAAACPFLRSVRLGLSSSASPIATSTPAVLAALAPLAHLQELALYGVCPGRMCKVAAGLAALADGPAGRSLRSIAFNQGHTMSMCKAAELARRSSSGVCYATPELPPTALIALARMPNLERFGSLALGSLDVEQAMEGVLALGRIASLREMRVDISGFVRSPPERASAVLRALADALSGLPRLEKLDLQMTCAPRGARSVLGVQASPEDVAYLLASDGARRALADLSLYFAAADRSLAEAEAEAIVALPALRRLRLVSCCAHGSPSFRIRPFEILRGLRPEVAVGVRHADPKLDVATRKMFAGRPPFEGPRQGHGARGARKPPALAARSHPLAPSPFCSAPPPWAPATCSTNASWPSLACRIERFGSLRLEPAHVELAVGALSAPPRLAGLWEAGVLFDARRPTSDGRAAAVLWALGEALSGQPRLARLDLEMICVNTSPEDVVALLSGDGARRALVDLRLLFDAERPLAESEAAALLALPALRRLQVTVSPCVDPGSPLLRPFEVLRGLRPEVAVRVRYNPQLDEARRAALEAMFAGRPPYSWPWEG
eukprot:tig00020557_g11129.t1